MEILRDSFPICLCARTQLNTKEKDVIQFLAENNGKAFESQIREKLPDIPRTTPWRLVKRLEPLKNNQSKKD
jgi:uncharacterized membrane protein